MFSAAKVEIYYKTANKIDKYFFKSLFLSKTAFLSTLRWFSFRRKNIINGAKKRRVGRQPSILNCKFVSIYIF
jgi:hypothetical protein